MSRFLSPEVQQHRCVLVRKIKRSYCRYFKHLWGIYCLMQSNPILQTCNNVSCRDLHHSFGPRFCIRTVIFGVYSISSVLFNLYDIVASVPLAFNTPSADFCAGIATGRPLAFAVRLTISRSINSLVSRARSSTSDGFKFFVSIGFRTMASQLNHAITAE
jgi:hypothetical protein